MPDNRLSGISDRIEVEATGKIRSIKVRVDISHQYIGDLQVMLTAPNGNQVLLHDRSGASGVQIQEIYSVDSVPELATLLESSAQGTWKIQVSDRAKLDIGTFNSWGLRAGSATISTAVTAASPMNPLSSPMVAAMVSAKFYPSQRAQSSAT
ncbi:MAG: hypothetical protein HC805_02930 [Alkalinema sp. RL_2_19]|nr:hypothetical protein [Alkalinema sp. RL_2_19]